MLYLCKYCISGLLAVELFQDEVQEVYMFPSAPKKTNNICVVGRLIWKDAANYADSRPSCKYRWHQQRRNLRESRKPKKRYGLGPFGKSGKSCPRSSVLIGLISCQKLVETFHHFFAEYHSLNK